MSVRRFIPPILVALVFFGLTVTSVSALTIKITSDGSVEMWESSVLGEESEVMQKEVEAREKIREQEQLKQRIKNEKMEKLQIRVKAEDNYGSTYQIEAREKEGMTRSLDAGKNGDLRVEFEDKEEEIRALRREKEQELERLRRETGGMSEEARRRLIEEKELRNEEEIAERRGELEQRREEVQERVEEKKLEINDRIRERGRELELGRPDGVKAKLRGAEFVVDSESGTVTVITPSGNEHELNHFPDDVVAKLRESGRVTDTSVLTDIDIEVKEDGQVIQRVKNVAQRRRVLGLFNREVQGDAIIDDATGEVTFEPENTFANRILRFFEQ